MNGHHWLHLAYVMMVPGGTKLWFSVQFERRSSLFATASQIERMSLRRMHWHITYAMIWAPATSMHVIIAVWMCVTVITIIRTHSHIAAGITHVMRLAAAAVSVVSVVGISAVLPVWMHLRRRMTPADVRHVVAVVWRAWHIVSDALVIVGRHWRVVESIRRTGRYWFPIFPLARVHGSVAAGSTAYRGSVVLGFGWRDRFERCSSVAVCRWCTHHWRRHLVGL